MKKLIGFRKGINFGGWLSQCDYSLDRLDNFITENDFRCVAGWGVDHVRVPIDYNILENEDGTYNESGFGRVRNAVLLAKKYGLNIIIDLHKTAGFSFDFGENEAGFFDDVKYRERFYRLWEQIAQRFAEYSDNAAFELLNEVTEKRFIGVWNETANECIRRIRAFAPDIPILVGSYWNNSPEAVSDLDKPYDENVYYNFHCYSPLEFTHQGATWTPDIDPARRISFEEAGITEELFENIFRDALKKAESEGTGVYCGEYGVIDRVSPEETLKWYRTIHNVFEKYDIGRAAWSYKEMDFGLSDERLAGCVGEIIKQL
ncbi:MAG: cellulase family glycosylhydrolase [Oscillospiraceae bacterium]|nr:cellulase family glycosylhydrolase [Oscillospiraceae bacterium]